MKYFFLSENWTTGRVWEFGGLWNELAWNRKPHLQRQTLYIQENGENLWLYQVEDAVLMVEVMPQSVEKSAIGQVVLKRLLTPEQVIERLCQEAVFHPSDSQPDVAATAPEPQVETPPERPSNRQHLPINDNTKRTAHTPKTVMARWRRLTGKRSIAKRSIAERPTTEQAQNSEPAQV